MIFDLRFTNMPSADLNIDFLQSEEWFAFQEAAGKNTLRFSEGDFLANGILYELLVIGKYLYIPRGPMFGSNIDNQKNIQKLIEQAKEKKACWLRIEPQTEELLEEIKKAVVYKVVKAPHDMQPREIFVVDISKSEEELFAAMKSKTRYNIRLAEKRGVKVFVTKEEKYKQAFLDLMQTTADRKEIVPHPRAYYEKFLSAFPEGMCQLFVAEYEGKVLAANLLLIFGTRATYLHGGSGSIHRDAMAPYLLQWEQMRYAKEHGCTEYDFGGVKTGMVEKEKNTWEGITRFKIGFSPVTKPVVFPGAYDIILDHSKYMLYDRLRMLKESFLFLKRFFKI